MRKMLNRIMILASYVFYSLSRRSMFLVRSLLTKMKTADILPMPGEKMMKVACLKIPIRDLRGEHIASPGDAVAH